MPTDCPMIGRVRLAPRSSRSADARPLHPTGFPGRRDCVRSAAAYFASSTAMRHLGERRSFSDRERESLAVTKCNTQRGRASPVREPGGSRSSTAVPPSTIFAGDVGQKVLPAKRRAGPTSLGSDQIDSPPIQQLLMRGATSRRARPSGGRRRRAARPERRQHPRPHPDARLLRFLTRPLLEDLIERGFVVGEEADADELRCQRLPVRFGRERLVEEGE